MQRNTQLGLITELHCQLDFSKYGILLSQPIINDSRYDYIADINNNFYRIQCKTSVLRDEGNAFCFPVSNKNWNSGVRKDYHGDIDFFYTYVNNQGYLIPIEETGKKEKILRLKSKQPNNSAICWAKNYEIEKILQEKLNYDCNEIQNTQNKTKKSICIDCGKEITYGATRCRQCNGIYCSKIIEKIEGKIPTKPTREELKNMIRKEPFTSIGTKYGVTDNSIRKWCDKYNLPRTKREIMSISDEDWSNI